MSKLNADDIIVPQNELHNIRTQLERNRRSSSSYPIKFIGKSLASNDIPVNQDYITSSTEAEAYAKWLVKSYVHAEYIAAHPELFVDELNNEASTTRIKHAGIESTWSFDDTCFVSVKYEAIDRLLSPIAVHSPTDSYFGNYRLYEFAESRYNDSYIGDSTLSVSTRALWLARRSNVINTLCSGSGLTTETLEGKTKIAIYSPQGYVAGSIARRLVKNLEQFKALTVSPVQVANYRNEIMSIQRVQTRNEENVRRQLATQNFRAYWDNLKNSKRASALDESLAAVQWATIPLVEAGTESSRTWGIEVETVHAERTSRPAGWVDTYDGSLETDSTCDCGCDYCYDGDEHCRDSDNDCNSDSDAREFVSPILRHFNSNGLRKLCNDIGDYEDNTTPGIHVHVGASDLTVMDVARLLFAYGVVAPLIQPLYHREAYGYCKEMSGENVQWWLSAVKSYMRTNGTLPTPRDICHDQPTDRYNDVNLHALSKHGTIEFRAMGPYYNYDHLVRWAWFVREMANVSTLGLDQRVWTSCKSINDVIAVLRKYGSELPNTKESISYSTNELVLTSEN